MRFLRRLFSHHYRKAIEAEASGEFIEAAKAYALCGEEDKVSDMHLAQARRAPNLDDRIISLRNALEFNHYKDKQILILRLLSEALERRGKQISESEKGKSHLLEAAELNNKARQYEKAGDLFYSLGKIEQAVEAYSREGLLEKVESILSSNDKESEKEIAFDQAYREYEFSLMSGERDKALNALNDCIQYSSQPLRYKKLHLELEGKMLSAAFRLSLDDRHLNFYSGTKLYIGRESISSYIIADPSISRKHCAIDFEEKEHAFYFEDLQSSNGSFIAGVRIVEKLRLTESSSIRLGENENKITIKTYNDYLHLQVEDGLNQGDQIYFFPHYKRVRLTDLDSILPHVDFAFNKTNGKIRPTFFTKKPALLNKKKAHLEIQLIEGDQIEINSKTLRISKP